MGNNLQDGRPLLERGGTALAEGSWEDGTRGAGSEARPPGAGSARETEPRSAAALLTRIHLAAALKQARKSSPSHPECVLINAGGHLEASLSEMAELRRERIRSARRVWPEGQGSTATANAPTSPSLDEGEVNGDTQEEMLEKARELFQLCDKEEKGLITKRDLQRLQSDLPLTPEQLEAVFDSLDQSNNGYLTPVEFSMGLGKLFGIDLFPVTENEESSQREREETFESGWSDELDDADSEEGRFCSMMEKLGAAQIFEGGKRRSHLSSQKEVRELWARLRKDRPELLANFEEFLFRVSSYIREVHHEKESMEQALKRKETDHGREVRCLYEEMEQQIKLEKERLLGQDSLKQNGKNTLLQNELRNKEQEMESIITRQKQLEQQLQAVNLEQVETRVQNEQLRQLNLDLHEQLERSKWDLDAAQDQLQNLQRQAELEQEQKASVVFKVSKNMQKEKQSLLRQLELLREMNKKLRDERDAFEAKKLVSLRKTTVAPVHHPSGCCCHHVGPLHCQAGH